MDNLSPLEERLGYRFKDQNLLHNAMTLNGASHEIPRKDRRSTMAWLGDSILNYIMKNAQNPALQREG